MRGAHTLALANSGGAGRSLRAARRVNERACSVASAAAALRKAAREQPLAGSLFVGSAAAAAAALMELDFDWIARAMIVASLIEPRAASQRAEPSRAEHPLRHGRAAFRGHCAR